MTLAVGFGPDVRSTAGLRLAGQLARSADEDLVLCCVVHDAFDTPVLRDAHDVDAEWNGHLRRSAEDALRSAGEVLPADVRVTPVLRTGRSVPQGLVDEGRVRGADLLVVGSAAVGNLGRIALGSTSDRLLHSSAVPVALAPSGYQDEGDIRRLVLAVEPTRGDVALAAPVVDLARRWSVPVDVVTFAIRQRTAFEALADQGVFGAWRDAVVDAHAHIAAELRDAGVSVGATGLHPGDRWTTALQGPEWRPGDLLVIGSSTYGPVARVFLGSTAARILRHSPVPVLVLPRG